MRETDPAGGADAARAPHVARAFGDPAPGQDPARRPTAAATEETVVTQKKLDFHPSRHGYHFANTFENHIGDVVVSRGRCGGMVTSALDYWRAGIAIAAHRADDFGAACEPAEGTRLRSYIYQRQLDGLAAKGTVSRRMVFPGPNTPEDFHGWAMHGEFELVEQQIDMRRPAVLGLWRTHNGPVGHCAGITSGSRRPARR